MSYAQHIKTHEVTAIAEDLEIHELPRHLPVHSIIDGCRIFGSGTVHLSWGSAFWRIIAPSGEIPKGSPHIYVPAHTGFYNCWFGGPIKIVQERHV